MSDTPQARQNDHSGLRKQAGAAVMALLKRVPLAPADQFGGLVGRLGTTEHDVADAVLTVVNPVLEGLRAELQDARSWARHGYEIGQRSATWSDQGVAPKWLTEGHNPAALVELRGDNESATRDAIRVELIGQQHAELTRQRESRAALSSLLRGMARRVDQKRKEIRELEQRPTQYVYETACEALETRRATLVQALGLPPETAFYDAIEHIKAARE